MVTESAAIASDLFVPIWGSQPTVNLLVKTYTLFASLQTIAAEQQESADSQGLPTSQTLEYYFRIINLYRDALKDFQTELESEEEEDEDVPSYQLEAHLRAQRVSAILGLLQTLYFPADGRGAGVVGEELLHWLNSWDFAPTTQEGREIAESAVPYMHPNFWEYTCRCVLRGFHSAAATMLSSLSTHLSISTARVSKAIIALLHTFPRSVAFSLESDFLAAHRRWVAKTRALLSGLEDDMNGIEDELRDLNVADPEDLRLEFEAGFRCLLEIMAGGRERVFEVCVDWREALAAWGTLVQPSLKRDDVPETMSLIFERFPYDATLPYELVQVALVQGATETAAQRSRSVDPWLAAHMTDIMFHAGLLDETIHSSTSPKQLRQDCLVHLADRMVEEQGLWKVALDYFALCEEVGRKRMRTVVLGAFHLNEASDKGKRREIDSAFQQDQEGGEAEETDSEFARAEEVLAACARHGLLKESRLLCKRIARAMTQQRRWGLAIQYSIRGEDGAHVRRVADDVLDVYIDSGHEDFLQAVDSIPPSLLTAMGSARSAPREEDVDDTSGLGDMHLDAVEKWQAVPFLSSRLMFLGLYRSLHSHFQAGDLHAAAQLIVQLISSKVAPERFWAVLLVDALPLLEDDPELFSLDDTCELLRSIEQITSCAATHPEEARLYLEALERILSRASGTNHERSPDKRSADQDEIHWATAAKRLEVVRLSLARHLARLGALTP